MSFLAFDPSVFVIGEEYEFLFCLKAHGLLSVRVGEALYYEDSSGALPTERTVARVRVPQAVLNAAGGYEVIFREAINRRAYESLFEEEERAAYPFSPLPTEGPLNIYFVSDVHCLFESAKATVSFFGDDLHMLIAAGDIAEVEREEHYLAVAEFLGAAAGGRLPILMVRGNHDTRGRLAERFTDYFPADGKKTYYTFEIGTLCGVVLDFGEDKLDTSLEYDNSQNAPEEYLGINRFHAYRAGELEFLKGLQPREDKRMLILTHICPSLVTQKPGPEFDIDRPLYTAIAAELDRIQPSLMLCGHYHVPFYLSPADTRNRNPHSYPIVMGANRVPTSDAHEHFGGTAIHLKGRTAEIAFTDEAHTVWEKFTLDI